MKDSARYPIWFGKAWVFVHEHMKKNPGKEMSNAVLNAFTAKMVQRMFIDEDMVCQLIVISLGTQFLIIFVFFQLEVKVLRSLTRVWSTIRHVEYANTHSMRTRALEQYIPVPITLSNISSPGERC